MLRDDAWVAETFPSRGLTWTALVLGAVATCGTLVLFVWMARSEPGVLVWCTPFALGFAAGTWAFLRRPADVAARRLLVFGALAVLFIGTVVGFVVAYDELGQRWWLAPGNVAAQAVGLTFEAAMIAMLAVYPDGTYHRRFERWVVRTAAVLAPTLPLALLVASPEVHPMRAFLWGEDDGTTTFPSLASPLHVPALEFLALPLRAVVDAALALGPLVGALLVASRYRRLSPRERRQIRWPSYGVLLLGLTPVAAVLAELGLLSSGARDAVIMLALSALPVSTAVGLVRPELFDIDQAARRSLVFAPLWIAIAGTYVGVAAALGFAASALGVPAVVAVTLLAAVLFEPIRRRFTRRAATWAYGEPLDAAQVMTWLEQAMQRPLDVEQVVESIAATTTENLGVLWTRLDVEGLPPVRHGHPDSAEHPSTSAELAHAGRRFGTLACGPRERGGAPPDAATVQTVAVQVATVLHSVGLAADLRSSLAEQRRQSAELVASRSRLVEAEESARRRIERDLHDGAQQELVGLSAQIGLARAQYAEVDGVEATLGDLQEGVREALDQLRRLAHGIHPTELADHGLVEAIEGRSARLPVRVRVTCDPTLRAARFGERIETAAYFFVSEALTNVVKHAGVEDVRVILTREGDDLVVDVADDGTGFDVSAASGSPGLRGLRDRIEAVGGSVELRSTPGAGTTIRARLPARVELGSTS